MDARYLFRGKRHDTGEWIEGYYAGPIGWGDVHEICDIDDITGSRIEIDPQTLGQCTGLRDRTGALIFEGDILEASYLQEPFAVEWREGSWMLSDNVSIRVADMDLDKVKIIGNIHDNPELLTKAGEVK